MADGVVDPEASFCFAILTAVVCAAQIVGVTIFLLCNYKKLSLDKSKRRCGYFYEELNYENGRATAMFMIVYQMRFLVMAFVIIFMGDYRVIQVLIVSLATISVATTLGTLHPYKELR